MQKQKHRDVFNLKEAAAYLGISIPTLTALLRGGEIPFRRAGQRWLIARAALDHWLCSSGERPG